MDTGDIAIVVTLGISSIAILITLFAFMRSFSERISDVEREQARLEGANGTLSEVLKQQSHTHESSAD